MILIVEDDELISRDLRRKLTGRGYRIAGVVPSGEEAIEVARMSRPELALMDMSLKGVMDGVQTAQKLRDEWNIPTIYLTGHDEEAIVSRAKLTRPLGYLLKPVDAEELFRTIELALYNNQVEKSLARREFQSRYLSDATQLLTSSLDPQVVAQRLVDFIVPSLADFCILDSVIEGEQGLLAVSHVEPSSRNLLKKIIPMEREKGQVIFEPLLATDRWKNLCAVYEGPVEQDLPCYSLISLPLVIQNEEHGSLTIGLSKTPRRFEKEDLEMARELANRATIALEHGRLFRQTQHAKETLEQRVEERTRQWQEAHARVQVLLKEVHHRVKNNMQVVSSLLRLQSDSLKDASAIEALRQSYGRIRSMALVHELLYQTENVERINLSHYLTHLTQHLFTSYSIPQNNIRLVIDVPEVWLDLDTAVPCGLIATEFITNALKYAYPDNRGGTLHVRFESIPGQRGILTIADDGVGLQKPVEWDSVQTVGFRIISALTRQIRGQVRLLPFTGKGTSFQLEFPYKAVKPSPEASPA